MELNITVPGNKKAKKETLQISDTMFACDFNKTLVHQVVNAFLSGARAGTKAQKNRSAVRGGGKKPWKQKGTGRARAGTSRSPLWRSGGVTFAAQPRDYSQKVNKKMYRGALRSIFSELVRQERLKVIDSIDVDEPKTKMFVKILKDLDMSNVLIINDSVEEKLYLASRNIPNVDIRDVQGVDPLCLLKHDNVIVTVPALKHLEEWLG